MFKRICRGFAYLEIFEFWPNSMPLLSQFNNDLGYLRILGPVGSPCFAVLLECQAETRTQFQEHIDLRKFFPGFVISYRMPFFQVPKKSKDEEFIVHSYH